MFGIISPIALFAAFVLTVAAAPSPDSTLDRTWQGRIETLVVDNFETGTSHTRVFLHTPEETLELDGAEDAGWQSGQMVEITGTSAGKRLAVSRIAPAAAGSATTTCSAIGEQKVAVILVSFPSKALLSSVTPTLMSGGFFGSGPTLDTFLRESSFGRTWATGDVLGPFVLDADYFDQPLAARDAALRAASRLANLTKYSGFFIVGPQSAMGMDSGGMALIGCGAISSPQGTLNASSMWLGAESMVTQSAIATTAAHEIGHGFGLEHARFADYGTDALGPKGQVPAPWDQLHEYGDSFSSMGRNGHWAAPHKAQLGWLQTGANFQNVTAAGAFTLSPYELAGSGQAIRVRRGATNDAWLWLEFRQPLGAFDSTLPPAAFAGALVHYEDPVLAATLSGVSASTYTNLVNFHPSTYANDPTLHPGETWSDPYGSLSLKVNSSSAARLSVTVSYAAAPVCPGSAGPAQAFAASGGTGQIPVATPANCSWSATPSVPWITLGSTTSGTGYGSLSFSVAANPNTAPRWGKISVGGAFAIVTQAGADGSISISPQTAALPASGGVGQIAVSTSAPDFAWSYVANVPWITDLECSCFQSVGPATLRYVVAEDLGAQRTGAITVGGLVFTIAQQGGGADPDSLAWTLLSPQNAPTARMNLAMAPFGHSGQAVLYGGNWNTTVSKDTWLWNGSAWTLLAPANNPGARAGHAMVYDEARGQIVLFGGLDSSGAYTNQTWVWDGTNWSQKQPATNPPARYGHAMAYDAIAQKAVLFGGYGNYAEANDTWTWDGSNWTQAAPLASPAPRTGHSMAFDPIRGETVLFGGSSSQDPTWFGDTWAWDGVNWQQRLSATPPAARAGHVLAYHPGLNAVVMIGGAGGKDITSTSWNYDFRKETWLWNGQVWIQQFPANQPGPAYSLGAAYNDVAKGLTVHLGDDLTCISRGPKTFLFSGTAVGISAVPGFRLTLAALTATVVPGGSTAVKLSATAFNAFQSQLALSASGLPTGVTAAFAPAAIPAPGNGVSTLTITAASNTAAGTYAVTVSASGGGVGKSQTINLTVSLPPSFALASSAASATVAAGASSVVKLTTAKLNGFQSAVALSVSGLPAGVTAAFAPASIPSPGAGASTLTLTAASSAVAGSYSLTLTASGGGLTKTQPLTLTISSFTLTASAASATVVVGASTAVKLTTAALNGFPSAVSLSVSGLPKGVTASFSLASIAAPANGVSVLTLSAALGTPAGTFTLTVTATGGGIAKTQPLALTVPAPGFRLTAATSSATVARGASTAVKLTAAAINGFQSQIALSASGLPKGVTASFSPSAIASPGNGASTLTLAAAPGTVTGTYSLTLTAAGGGITSTQTLTLRVM